nr:kelch repeat-containing protein [Anaerovorax sp. IOR16]
MSEKKYDITAAAINEKIYVFGGDTTINGVGGIENKVEIYDIATKKWTQGKPMPTARSYAAAVTIGSKIFVMGGRNDEGLLDTVEIYDTVNNTWESGIPLPTPRSHFGSVSVGDKIYVLGGSDNVKMLNTLDIYDTQSKTWSTGEPMPTKRYGLTASVVGNYIYAIGGATTNIQAGIVDKMEIYDIKNNTWTVGKPMSTARRNAVAAVIGNKIFAIGGFGESGYIKTVEIYDTMEDAWTNGPSIEATRSNAGAATIKNKIYVIGGYYPTDTMISLQVGAQTTTLKLSVLLNIGENVQLSTSYNLADNANYTWSSTNEAVATVDANGKVTAVAVGETDIYAQNADGTFKEYIPVKVVEGIADELRLAVHLKAGEKAKLYLTDNPGEVIWSSMDESVVTVSSDGQVTGIKKGLAIIQGELAGQTYQIYVRVNG